MKRAVAALGALVFGVTGLWALVAPRSFFDSLATFEPYNPHLFHDLGAFQLGLAAVLVLALVWKTDVLRIALGGAGIGAVIHFVSHIIDRDLGGKPASDIPLLGVFAAVLIFGATRKT